MLQGRDFALQIQKSRGSTLIGKMPSLLKKTRAPGRPSLSLAAFHRRRLAARESYFFPSSRTATHATVPLSLANRRAFVNRQRWQN